LQDNRLSNGILRNTSQGVFSAIFEDQLNCIPEILSTLFNRTALAISARDLWTVSNEPLFVLFYNRCEFIVHSSSYELIYIDQERTGRAIGALIAFATGA